jgi:hypothetical protein
MRGEPLKLAKDGRQMMRCQTRFAIAAANTMFSHQSPQQRLS